MIRSRRSGAHAFPLIISAIGVWYVTLAPVLAALPSDVRVLNASSNGVEFLYTPTGDGPTVFHANERAYTRFLWDYIDAEGQVGQPEIPVRNFLFVIRSQAFPSVAIVRDNARTQAGIRLAPIPTRSPGQNGVDIEELIEQPEAYASAAPIPIQQIAVSEPFSYRGYRLVRVSVYPVQYYPVANQARISDRIHIRVNWSGNQSPARSSVSGIDPVVRDMVLNPEQMGLWRLPQSTDVAPPWPSGTMVKIVIREEGIFKITGQDLEQIGVSLTGIDPDQLRLYNNGGRELPRAVASPRPDSLIENAIDVVDVGYDGSFDPEDYFLFYGHGVTGWDRMDGFFQHYIHHYTEDNIYWLQLDPIAPAGKRMIPFGLSQPPNQTVTNTRTRMFREDEDFIYNTSSEPESGTNWYMALFSDNQSRSYNITLSDVDQSQPFRIRARFKHLTGGHQIKFYLNGTLAYTTTSISMVDFSGDGSELQDGTNTLRIEHILTQGATSKMYLDWFELEYSRSIAPVQNESAFESPTINGIVKYELSGFSNPQIFNITDPYNVAMTPGSEVTDTCNAQVWSRYFAVNAGHYRTPLSMQIQSHGGDEYQDLRTDLPGGIDYIIISADEFYPVLVPYENHRESFQPSLNTIRIRVSDVFDQFAWGLFDPTAIRDFLKYVSVNWQSLPEYVLLVGDGDYDYKNRVSGPTGNWIPPNEDGSKCADDWYVYFSDSPNQSPQMAMGRWTVTSAEETEIIIQKVIQYEDVPLYGPWRHRITMVADDEYGDGGQYSGWEENHTRDSESIAESILPRHFNLTKIYLINYPVVWDAAAFGPRKPQAADDLVNSINDGALIVNYVGHGNPHVWAHEEVFSADRDLPRIQNGNHLSVFIAATCSWGLFDDPVEQSFPEQLLAAPGRGSVATIAATRFTGSTSNEYLVRNFYTEAFENPFSPRTLGSALLVAKTLGSSETEKYHILGDPTLVVGAPRFQVRIESTSADTLQALSLFTLNGVALDEGDNVWEDFAGTMNLTVFDRRDSIHYVFDSGSGSPFAYIMQGSPIFRGPCTISQGHFQSQFIVPQDIAYGSQSGRFSFYYYGLAGGAFNDSTDGAGVRDSVCFAETAADVTDSIPPVIDLMLENEFFRENDIVSQYPQVIASVSDSSGVNLTGEIGHKLRLILDGGTSWDVTRDFEYMLDSYSQGEMRTTIGPISPGNHLLRMEAWDSFNNFAWTEVAFVVAEQDEEGFQLRDLLPYPNPFSRHTNLTFYSTRNAWATLKIYTVAGRLIYSQEGIWVYENRFNWELIWDGRDEEGDKVANGVYLYKLSATSTSGEHCSEIGRVVVMR